MAEQNLPDRPQKTVYDLLQDNKQALQMALPKHLTPDRMIRVAWTAIRKNPLLMKCSQASLVSTVIECAQLGLLPDGVLGHAYLVPYRNGKSGGYDAQLQIGYKGLIALARRSGDLNSLSAQAVYKNDEFQFSFGLDENLVHKPNLEGDRGALRAVYAVAKWKDGGHDFEVMSKADVDKIKNRSKASSNGPWKTDYDEMAKKTVIRRLAKRLPLSTEDFQRAAAMDEWIDAGMPQHLEDADVVDVETDEWEKPFVELCQDLTNTGKLPSQADEDECEKNEKALLSFIQETATANNLTKEKVITEATANLDSFWQAFTAWQKKHAKQEQPKATKQGRPPKPETIIKRLAELKAPELFIDAAREALTQATPEELKEIHTGLSGEIPDMVPLEDLVERADTLPDKDGPKDQQGNLL